MTVINKQKFLAELAKLLTFMYEEDRQCALAAYNEMFDEAEDEQALLQALVSPLRQAVEVARAYNAGKPALDNPPKKGEEEAAQSLAYLETIHRIRAEAFREQPEKEPVNEDQFSLFDEAGAASEDEQPQAAPVAAAAVAEAVPAEETEAVEAPAPVTPAEPEEAPAEAPEAAPAESEPEHRPDEAPAGDEEASAAEEEDDDVDDEGDDEEEDEEDVLPADEPKRLPVLKTVRKARVPLLILYALIAIPLTLIGVVVLLVPALACLALAIGCGILSILIITAALGSFPKIANLLVALGAALILLAIALLMLMLFIWFLGGAIGGLIRGVIDLGGKWCYKEVAAE